MTKLGRRGVGQIGVVLLGGPRVTVNSLEIPAQSMTVDAVEEGGACNPPLPSGGNESSQILHVSVLRTPAQSTSVETGWPKATLNPPLERGGNGEEVTLQNRPSNLTYPPELDYLVKRYPRMFSGVRGMNTLYRHEFEFKEPYKPDYTKHYELPGKRKEEGHPVIQDWLRDGTICHSDSRYRNPLVAVL